MNLRKCLYNTKCSPVHGFWVEDFLWMFGMKNVNTPDAMDEENIIINQIQLKYNYYYYYKSIDRKSSRNNYPLN